MNWISQLFVDNPMLIEIRLFRRKFFGSHVIANTLAVAAIAFLLALIIGLLYVYDITYEPASFVALAVVSLLVPVFLHGAIAGERERRSWDMLLVAPITNAQIVIGKFVGAGWPILLIGATFGVAIFVSSYPDGDRWPTGSMIFLVVLSYSFAVAGFSLFISSLCKRSMTALGIIYGTLFFILVVLPSLISATVRGSSAEAAFYLNPFYAVTEINHLANNGLFDSLVNYAEDGARNSYLIYGGVHVILYSVLALAFLASAIYQLNASGLDDPMLKKAK